MKIKKKHKDLGFTNKMFLYIIILSVAVTVFACMLMWHTGDTSPLAYLIPSVFGELATITGFAVKKSEKENTKGGIVYDQAINALNNENVDINETKG